MSLSYLNTFLHSQSFSVSKDQIHQCWRKVLQGLPIPFLLPDPASSRSGDFLFPADIVCFITSLPLPVLVCLISSFAFFWSCYYPPHKPSLIQYSLLSLLLQQRLFFTTLTHVVSTFLSSVPVVKLLRAGSVSFSSLCLQWNICYSAWHTVDTLEAFVILTSKILQGPHKLYVCMWSSGSSGGTSVCIFIVLND